MGERKDVCRVLLGTSEGKGHLKYPDVDVRMILRCGGMDWIDLAQDMDRWHALVNAVMNLRIP